MTTPALPAAPPSDPRDQTLDYPASNAADADLFELLLQMGDTTLILGHRLSEWCGKAPVLEEDIALANIALDLIGQTQLWLGLACEVEGNTRSADDLAMLRDAWDFRCCLLVQQPNGDFGQTMMRQFLFDYWHLSMLSKLAHHPNEAIAAIATKAQKEVTYHAERSLDLVIRLGDGTEESHTRMQAALDLLFPFVGELFTLSNEDLRPSFDAAIEPILKEATLTIPESRFFHQGGFTGARHSEHLGHLLSKMQWLQRAYPGATW